MVCVADLRLGVEDLVSWVLYDGKVIRELMSDGRRGTRVRWSDRIELVVAHDTGDVRCRNISEEEFSLRYRRCCGKRRWFGRTVVVGWKWCFVIWCVRGRCACVVGRGDGVVAACVWWSVATCMVRDGWRRGVVCRGVDGGVSRLTCLSPVGVSVAV